ncbi:AAA family ATPase [Rikenella microfusus]|uniref:cytidylate kinase-like family protein n=1 Tax=Rikenella microfusus TaxID=28139 RepID=UPI00248E5997|nr:cytidylate kinase-like family protein [Rikenella microfusus]
METPRFVITIGRQFGSGGRELGRRLADLFGIPYYDKELISEASKESGLDPEYFEKADEQAPGSLIRALTANLMMSGGAVGAENALAGENIFKFQSDVIREVARTGSCVIVGRCADYILRNEPVCISTFIYASDDDRISRVMRCHGAGTPKEALEMMRKTDKKRAGYYNFYTDRTWGAATTYNLCIDSSVLGIEKTAELLRDYVEERLAAAARAVR